MKKTLTAITLALALMLSMAPAAFAAPNEGQGSVLFSEDSNPPEIVDPTDPPEVVDPTNPPTDYSQWGIKNGNIDFGAQEIVTNAAVYKSQVSARNVDDKVLGMMMINKNLKDWKITVQIDEFKIGTDSAIPAFNLLLDPVVTSLKSEGSVPTPLSVNLQPGAAYEADFFTGTGVTTAGCNWEGELQIPAGGVKKVGESAAVITWTSSFV